MKISVVTPCFNESENIKDLILSISKLFTGKLKKYRYEHIVIDNQSTDGTKDILKKLAKDFKNLKIIINTRNFGHIQSPHYARLQASGDAIINLASDFQDPPELIPRFIEEWENGAKVVLGIKTEKTNENKFIRALRDYFYKLSNNLSHIEIYENFSSFCLIDRKVMEIIKKQNDNYPYFRGLLSSLGFKHKKIFYDKNLRKRGISKNNFYTLYDIGILGLTKYSKIPLRICVLLSFVFTISSVVIGVFYIIYKLIFWNDLFSGFAPLIILFCFFVSFICFFLGIVGEYILTLASRFNTIDVVEEERINFD